MSRGNPLGCLHFHASHNFTDSPRRLSVGCFATSSLMNRTSAPVTARPRYRSSVSMPKRYHQRNWNASADHSPTSPYPFAGENSRTPAEGTLHFGQRHLATAIAEYDFHAVLNHTEKR